MHDVCMPFHRHTNFISCLLLSYIYIHTYIHTNKQTHIYTPKHTHIYTYIFFFFHVLWFSHFFNSQNAWFLIFQVVNTESILIIITLTPLLFLGCLMLYIKGFFITFTSTQVTFTVISPHDWKWLCLAISANPRIQPMPLINHTSRLPSVTHGSPPHNMPSNWSDLCDTPMAPSCQLI